MISAVGFGILFWLLGTRVVPAVGFAATVWMIRLTSSVLTAVRDPCAAAANRAAHAERFRLGLCCSSMGVLDTGAFVLNNRGMQLEQISVVSVLASLYGAVTVLLAAVDSFASGSSRWQWLGIVAIFAGIGLISR